MKKITLCIAAMLFGMHFFASAQITFAPSVHISIPATSAADHIAKGDFNHDGRTDAVVVTGFSFGAYDYKLLVYPQLPGGGLSTSPTLYSYTPVYPGARAVAGGDVNHDGLDDVVIGFGDSIGIFSQNFLGTLNPQVNYQCNPGISVDALKIYDVDGDGNQDIVTVSWFGQVVVFYTNAIGGVTRVAYPTAVGAGYDDIDVGKLAGDSLVSIVEMGGQSWAPVTQIRIHTNRTVDTTIVYHLSVTDNMHGVAIGDFYGTGRNQIAASYGGNVPSSHLAVWRHPDTLTINDTVLNVADIPQPVETGKFDCSGRDQIVVLHGGWSKVSVIDMTTGIAPHLAWVPNNAQPDGLAIGDFNGDGKNDIVSVNTYAGISLLLNTTATTDTFYTVHRTSGTDTLHGASYARTYDTVAYLCGSIATKDSVVIESFIVDSFHMTDSSILVRDRCHPLDTVMWKDTVWSNSVLSGMYSGIPAHYLSTDTLLWVVSYDTAIAAFVSTYSYDTIAGPATTSIAHDTTSVPCGMVAVKDSVVGRLYWRDSSWIANTFRLVRNHCSGDSVTTLLASSFGSVLLGSYSTVLHFPTTDTFRYFTDTLSISVHSSFTDTAGAGSWPYTARDTTAFVCGRAVRKDSMFIQVHRIDFVSHTDSTVIVRHLCAGDTVLFMPLAWNDTPMIAYYPDTIHHITMDTVLFRPDTTVTVAITGLLDTFLTGTSTVVTHDATPFVCGTSHRTDSMVVDMHVIQMIHTKDSDVAVRNHCTGALIDAHHFVSYDTIVAGFYSDTAHHVTMDTVLFPPDTSSLVMSDPLLDTTPTIIFSYAGGDTSYVTTAYTVYHVVATDSLVTIRNHCTGATLSSISYLHRDTTASWVVRDTTWTIMIGEAVSNTADRVTAAVYPNPYTDAFTVEASGQIAASLYGANGQFIAEKTGDKKIIFSADGLASGMYVLRISVEGVMFERKLIKQ